MTARTGVQNPLRDSNRRGGRLPLPTQPKDGWQSSKFRAIRDVLRRGHRLGCFLSGLMSAVRLPMIVVNLMLQELAPRSCAALDAGRARRARGARSAGRRGRGVHQRTPARCGAGPSARDGAAGRAALTRARSCCCRASATRWWSSPPADRARGPSWAHVSPPIAASQVGRCEPARRSCCTAARTPSPALDHPRDLASSVVVPLALSWSPGRRDQCQPRARCAAHGRNAARLLELLANQAAILIDSVQMLDELQRKDQRLEQLVDQLLGETGRRPIDQRRSAGAAYPPRAPGAGAAGRRADQSRDRDAAGRRARHDQRPRAEHHQEAGRDGPNPCGSYRCPRRDRLVKQRQAASQLATL